MGMNEKLAELRRAKGLTQKELAETLHVSRQAISRWEVGTAAPSLDNLTYLSQLYGVPLDDLVNEGTPVSEAEEATPPYVPEAEEIMPSHVPEDLAPAPVNIVRPRIPLIPLLLTCLILGVGILIGISLRKPKEEIYLYPYPSDPGEPITVEHSEGWLEKTPADLEDEKEYLGSGGQAKDYYSIYYPDSGLLKTFPNDSSEQTPTIP